MQWCACAIEMWEHVFLCKYPCEYTLISRWLALPQEVWMNVIVRVSLRAACQLFVLEFVHTEKRSLDAELPLLLLWWKAALIEWPGTQPPFLIITAVQSLLITLKACRAPHSPVMLRAIRGSERKIRRFWQNPLSKTAKEGGKGGRRQSSVAASRLIFLSQSSSWWSWDAVYY